MLYIINNKIYNILLNEIKYNNNIIVTLPCNIYDITHNRYFIFILTVEGIYIVDHLFNMKLYHNLASERELLYIACNSRDIYYSTLKQVYKLSITHAFLLEKPEKILEIDSNILSIYVGEYYRAVHTVDNIYVTGMNSFMQFGEELLEKEYPSFTPVRKLGIPYFTPKSIAYFTQQSIHVDGKYSQTIQCDHIISNVAVADNILLYTAATVSHEIIYNLYLFDLNTRQYIQSIPLSEECFLIGMQSLHLFDRNITVLLRDHTSIQLQAVQQPATGGQQQGQQQGQQAVSLISTGSTAYHTIYNTVKGLIQTGRCYKQGHAIIQNTQLIKKILTNTTHTLFLFHTGAVYIMGNIDGSIEQISFNEPVIDAALGQQHMIFAGASGTVYCTGDNSFGQLGISTYSSGTETILTLPCKAFEQKADAIFASLGIIKETLGPNAFVIERVYAGIDTSFFIARDGSIYCCGNNSHGQLGIGTKNTRNVPVRMTRFCSIIALSGETVQDIRFTFNATVFLLSSRRIMTAGQLPSCLDICNLFPCVIPDLAPACTISTGFNHYVLRFIDNSTISSDNVRKSGVSRVICGAYHTIYLFTNGAVETDGQNGYGQLNIANAIL